MPKLKNLNGIPNNVTKSFFGTERYYIRGYMGDWLSNAAACLNINEATLDIMTAEFFPKGLNLLPLNLHAQDLKKVVYKELLANGFSTDFIVEAKINFQFLRSNGFMRKIKCYPYIVDVNGRRYEANCIVEDVYEVHFDPFAELSHTPKIKQSFWEKVKRLFGRVV
jgi:hypothetical protein